MFKISKHWDSKVSFEEMIDNLKFCIIDKNDDVWIHTRTSYDCGINLFQIGHHNDGLFPEGEAIFNQTWFKTAKDYTKDYVQALSDWCRLAECEEFILKPSLST